MIPDVLVPEPYYESLTCRLISSTRNLAAASDTLIRRIPDRLTERHVILVELPAARGRVVERDRLVGRDIALECLVLRLAERGSGAAADASART